MDYVFAGPRFEAIDPVYADEYADLHPGGSKVLDNSVRRRHVSDHWPLLVDIPIRITDPIPRDKADHLRGPVSRNAKDVTNIDDA